MPTPGSADLTLTPMKSTSGTAKFDLTFNATEVPEGLKVEVEYATDLFDAATIDRMLGHFVKLLEGIVADPDSPVGSIPMMTDEERRRLIGQSNEDRIPARTSIASPMTSWTRCSWTWPPRRASPLSKGAAEQSEVRVHDRQAATRGARPRAGGPSSALRGPCRAHARARSR